MAILYSITLQWNVLCNKKIHVVHKMSVVLLYAFFWVIPQHLNFICRCFGTLCLFHLHRQVGVEWICLQIWYRQSVPKRRHIKFRCRGITRKKAYKIQNIAKVLNQGWLFYLLCNRFHQVPAVRGVWHLWTSA
jgi:hypothetical protein